MMASQRIRQGVLALVSIFFCYLLFCEFFFVTHVTGSIFQPLSMLVLIPAATIDGESVSYHAVMELTHGVEGFSDGIKQKEAFHQALETAVDRLYVKRIADDANVSVSWEEISAYPLNEDAIAPGLERAKWTEKDYRKYVVAPLLLAQKTQTAISKNPAFQSGPLASMESIRKKLDQGMLFADAAEQFSEDVSAKARGDLGIVSVGDLPDWLRPAATLEPGDISDVLSAPDAYWTITALEFYPSDVPELAAVHFRGIAVKKNTFGAVVFSSMSENPPIVFVW